MLYKCIISFILYSISLIQLAGIVFLILIFFQVKKFIINCFSEAASGPSYVSVKERTTVKKRVENKRTTKRNEKRNNS